MRAVLSKVFEVDFKLMVFENDLLDRWEVKGEKGVQQDRVKNQPR